MKRYNIIVIVFFLVLILHLSTLNCQDTWVKTYNPYNYEWIEGIGWTDLIVYYEIEDIIIAQDGGYVVSGSIDRYLPDTPPMWWDHWGFLMKTDSDGNLLWAKKDSVDFLAETDNYAFTETDEGDFISIGYYYFGGGYMIKRDSEGNELWSVQYDDFGANSMCKTNDGNIVLGGAVFGAGNYDIALRKLDTDGNTLWTQSYDRWYTGIAYSITQTSDDGFALTGLGSGNVFDVIIMKTDANGDSLWTKTFDVNNESDRGNCISETSDNNLIVSGNNGFFGMFDGLGDTEFIQLYSGWNLRSCLQTYDDNYVLFTGWSTLKTNEYGDTLWYNTIFPGGSTGDRSIRELDNHGLLCIGCYGSNIYIFKTDTEGNYTNVGQKLVSLNSTNLSNYPNPFNPVTIISFDLQQNIENPIIEIYNIKGQKVKTLVCRPEFIEGYGNNESNVPRTSTELSMTQAGNSQYSVRWNSTDKAGNSVSSGIYLYRLVADEFVSKCNKMMLLK